MKDIFTLLDEFMEANGREPDYDDLALHFYELGKQAMKTQMMKEAVDAIIYGYDDGSYELIASWLDLPKGIYKNGDKVRIIIVKEESK